MPQEVWLERITADLQGKVTLDGNSLSQAMVYEFGKHLKESPGWSYVTVEGTWDANASMGRTTKFAIECEIDGQEVGVAEVASNE